MQQQNVQIIGVSHLSRRDPSFRNSAPIAASRRPRMRTIWSPISAAARVVRVYEAEPTIDFHLESRRSLIGIAVHRDEALRLLDLSHQIIGGHGLVSVGGFSKLFNHRLRQSSLG
jgi:hypothetical protein